MIFYDLFTCVLTLSSAVGIFSENNTAMDTAHLDLQKETEMQKEKEEIFRSCQKPFFRSSNNNSDFF